MNIKNIKGHPFSNFSAEEEKQLLKDIFYEPSYYKELRDVVLNGASRLLVGQRGFGKSVTIYSLYKDLAFQKTLPILIHKYDGIPVEKNESDFLCVILKAITNEIAKHLFTNNEGRRKLNDYQKNKLSFFIQLFYDPSTASYYIEKAKEIKNIKRGIWIRSFFNKNLKAINIILSCAQSFTSTLLRESLQIPAVDSTTEMVKSFLHEVDVPKIESVKWSEIVLLSTDTLKEYLTILIDITKTIGFNSIAILFDGIDEYKLVSSDAVAVTKFTEGILRDTQLLYTDNLSIVFSLWSEVKNSLNTKGVRFDKFPEIHIDWTDGELESLINKRLLHFSENKLHPLTLEQLVGDQTYRNQILELANKSPRSLIDLLHNISYKETNEDVVSFSARAIADGIMVYCKTFDYISLCPLHFKDDYMSWLNKLLSIRLCDFSLEQMATSLNLKTKTSTPQTYILELKKRGLVSLTEGVDGNNIYKIVDPRLRYLVSKGITEL